MILYMVVFFLISQSKHLNTVSTARQRENALYREASFYENQQY